ncbi:hypothetical protein Gotur_024850 [Gossypium turneri]
MGNGFLDRVEDNAAVRTWAEITQREKGDSLAEGYISELWDFTRVSVTQNNLQELREILEQCNDKWVTARIKQKGDSKCIPWKILKDLILAHPDARKKVDVFALGIYGLVIFPKILGHVDEAVTDLFDRLQKRVTPVSAILAETFRSLNACRRAGEEIVATPKRDDISEEKWMAIFQNLQEGDIEWRVPWLLPGEILYRCGDFNWVPLIGIWGAVGYAPLLVLRQYRSRQFVPTTQGLAECEFSYKGDGYKRRLHEMVSA